MGIVELTVKQRAVIGLIAKDVPQKEIAVIMGISPKTMASNMKALKRKIGVKGIAGLAIWAYQNNMVAP